MNVITGRGDGGEAVLIRALEPTEGIPVMQKRRGINDLLLLCSGPGRLTQALAITGEYNGMPLDSGALQIWLPDSLSGSADSSRPQEIVQTIRVGISRAKRSPYRFYLRGNRMFPGELKGTETGLKGFEPLTCGLRVRRYAELEHRPTLVRPNNVVDDAE